MFVTCVYCNLHFNFFIPLKNYIQITYEIITKSDDLEILVIVNIYIISNTDDSYTAQGRMLQYLF